MNKKVLIITYYWPPSGGAGVQRWLKFVKYLPEYGWTPVVYTPENPEAPAIDESLLHDVSSETEVIKYPIWEPYQWYKMFTGRKTGEKVNAGFLSEGEKPRFTEKLSIWVRGNFFIPDARKFWVKPSVRFLKKYLENNTIDAIVTTGPPHSMHLIGLALNRETGIPWMADFRDPWTEIDFYDKLMLTGSANKKHHKLERKVLQSADKVVTVGWDWAKGLEKLGGRAVNVVTNGFDPADGDATEAVVGSNFTITHAGAINADRNHTEFWKAIRELIDENTGFSQAVNIKLVGKNDVAVLRDIEEYELNNFVERIAYLPHNEVMPYLKSASVLYLPVNNTPNAKGILTGKVFEYLLAKRPVFAIGPIDGDLAKVIEHTSGGKICNFGDTNAIKQTLLWYFEQWKSGAEMCTSTNIDNFSRKNLTQDIAGLLQSIVDKNQ